MIFPIVAVLALVPLTIADAMGRSHPALRVLALTLLGVTVAANGASLVLLLRELLSSNSRMSGRQLLSGALIVWLSNLIVFALWFWELDRGGPRRRELDGGDTPDFLFPQMTDAKEMMPGWQPAFSDYLYTSSTNATAFSPTDTMPISGFAKLLMAAAVALVVRPRRARDRARGEHPQVAEGGASTTSARGRERYSRGPSLLTTSPSRETSCERSSVSTVSCVGSPRQTVRASSRRPSAPRTVMRIPSRRVVARTVSTPGSPRRGARAGAPRARGRRRRCCRRTRTASRARPRRRRSPGARARSDSGGTCAVPPASWPSTCPRLSRPASARAERR